MTRELTFEKKIQNLAEIRCCVAQQRADDAEEECHRLKAAEESCG